MGKSVSGHRKAGFARESPSFGLVRQRRAAAMAMRVPLRNVGKTRLILDECSIEMDLMGLLVWEKSSLFIIAATRG